ncbi:hypothetical protein [Plebeiibacterium marinum]|uniref:Uncharacterized protein n=1 Tax=Plebeiibacterium marinum TaxID=2992111 RepID=A0AAE3SJF1_9BACT|nr:hypothetical protein [Plebeiobacterium marinum]MCW3805404.1 hypothetical protein [Plebeiobacterium marinum]
MFATIHTITDDVIFRKSINWKNTNIKDSINIDCEKMYNGIESNFNKLIGKGSLKHVIKKARCYIDNLLTVKEKLSVKPWHFPTNLSPVEYQSFLQDTNFYLMISGVLIKASFMFSGFLSTLKNYSVVKLLPRFSSQPRKVNEALARLRSYKWIKTISYYGNHNAFLNALDEYKELINKVPGSSMLFPVVTELYKDLNREPVTQQEEEYLTGKLMAVNKRLSACSDFKEWYKVRPIILAGLTMAGNHEFYRSAYINILNETVDVDNSEVMHEELCFVKHEYEEAKLLLKQENSFVPKSVTYFKELVYQVAKLNKKKSSRFDGYIEWTHNPKEFVKSIHAAISNGYISLKGNTDMKPILEFLSQFIKVKKQNNKGCLTRKSLITYFKRANTGDL